MTSSELKKKIEAILDPLVDGQYAVTYRIFTKGDKFRYITLMWFRSNGEVLTFLDLASLQNEIFEYNLIMRSNMDLFDRKLKGITLGYCDYPADNNHLYEYWEDVEKTLIKVTEWLVKELN